MKTPLLILFSFASLPLSAQTAKSDSTSTGQELGEATVTATRLMFVTKKDTVVYDLDAFFQEQHENISEVMKRMPGMDFRDGTLYFKGRKVTRVMVNGIDFNRSDPKKALEQLPAYIVKGIKAYERKTDEATVTGIDDGTREQTIDIILRKKYMGTWTGNVDAGYGTDDYWLLRGFANTFTERMHISAYSGMTNTTQFQSASEETGEWNENGRGSGNTTYKKPSLYINWRNKREQGKKGHFNFMLTANWDYRYHNDFGRRQWENFLNEGSTYSLSNYHTRNHEIITFTYGQFTWNPSDNTYIRYSPSYSYTTWDSDNVSAAADWSRNIFDLAPSPLDSIWDEKHENGWPQEGGAINATRSHHYYTNHNNGYNHHIYATHKLSKKGYRVSFSNDFKWSNKGQRNNYMTGYRYFTNVEHNQPDLINRFTKQAKEDMTSISNLFFDLPLHKLLNLNLTYGNEVFDYDDTTLGYRLDRLGGTFADYKAYDAVFGFMPTTPGWEELAREAESSLFSDDHFLKHSFGGKLTYNNRDKGWVANFNGTIWVENEELRYQRGEMQPIERERNYTEYSIGANFRHENEKLGNFNFSTYRARYAAKFISMIDIPDTSDPLNITLGNPHLKPNTVNQVYFNYDKSWKNMRYVAFSGAWSLSENHTIHRYTYNSQTGVSTSQPVNVDGFWRMWLNADFSTPLDKEKHWTLGFNPFYNLSHNVAFATMNQSQPVRNSTLIHNISGIVKLRYQRPKFETNLKVTMRYNKQTSNYAAANNRSSGSLDYHWGLKWSLPWDLTLSSTINVRQFVGDDTRTADNHFDRLRAIWDASISKTLLRNKSLTLKLDCSDILNQRAQGGYYTTISSRNWYFTNQVQRFFMLRAIWRFTTKK